VLIERVENGAQSDAPGLTNPIPVTSSGGGGRQRLRHRPQAPRRIGGTRRSQ
jgi:hypothetical protein